MILDDGGEPGPGEIRLAIYLDRSLDLKTNLIVRRGTTIGAVKRRLADADPTGKADPASFALKLPFSFGEALGDSELVPEGLAELELCQPKEEEEEPFAPAETAEAAEANKDLAVGKNAEASSCKVPEREAACAVDGDPLTRWTSKYEDNHWLSVDLGAFYYLSRIDIRWEMACAASYKLQGSYDGSVWMTLASETGHEGWVSTSFPSGTSARWVRMMGLTRATDFGFSIWEFRVFEDEAAAARAQLQAEVKAAPQTMAVVPAQPEAPAPAQPQAPAAQEPGSDNVMIVVPGNHEDAIELRPQDVIAQEDPRPTTWRPPLKAGKFRLGELLWQGAAAMRSAPTCEFFPRQCYGALTLPPARKGFGASLLVFGGSGGTHGKPQNDVWRLSIPRLGAQRAFDAQGNPTKPRWTCVSPHDDGQLDTMGRRIMRKWRGRVNFGYTCAQSDGGGLLIYVAGGGDGTGFCMQDVWASQDGGAKWLCMCREAQWPRRASPALCAVPGRPDFLILAGGMGGAATVCQDAWTSDDAGATWIQLEQPIWGQTCGRYRAAMWPLAPRLGDDKSMFRVLLLGGCFIDGGEGGYGGFERLMHDGWEGHVDLHAPERAKAVTWKCWGSATDSRGRDWAKVGVEYATCAIDSHNGTLLGRLPSKDFLCVAEARPPKTDAEAIEWHQAESVTPCELLTSAVRDGAPDMAAMKLVYIRLASAGRQSIPRLVIIDPTEVLLSDDGEWRRQVRWALLLGYRLDRMFGIPVDLWHGRVLPSLLPAVVVPQRKQRRPVAGQPAIAGAAPGGQALAHR